MKKQTEYLKKIEGMGRQNSDIGRVVVKLDDHSVRAILMKEDGKLIITVPKEINSPTSSFILTEKLRKFNSGTNLVITVSEKFSSANVRLSHLKSAFLACSAAFGYSFALSENLSWVRKQISEGVESDLTMKYFSNESQVKNTFLTDNRFEIMFVRFNSVTVALPTSNTSFSRFCEIISNDSYFLRNFLSHPIPHSFLAQLDYNGKNIVESRDPQLNA